MRQARDLTARRRDADNDIKNEIGYLDKSQNRMRYDQYRAQGLFIGSGVIEAGCKNVIGQRLKQSGMFWTERGANAILALPTMVAPLFFRYPCVSRSRASYV